MSETPEKYASHDLRDFIVQVRGLPVILDHDLARAYGVTTAALNQAVKRNRDRFPAQFVLVVERQEVASLISQTVTSKQNGVHPHWGAASARGGRRKPTHAFTEHGAIMVSMILNSPRAVQMSVFVVQAFIAMRCLLANRQDLAKKLAELERRLTERLDVHEHAISDIIQQIMHLLTPLPPHPDPPKPSIGFSIRERRTHYGQRATGRIQQEGRP